MARVKSTGTAPKPTNKPADAAAPETPAPEAVAEPPVPAPDVPLERMGVPEREVAPAVVEGKGEAVVIPEGSLTIEPSAIDLIRGRIAEHGLDAELFDAAVARRDYLPPAVKGGRIDFVAIVGPRQGRRRAGMLFGPTERRIPRAWLTDSQFAALQADPVLTVGTGTIDVSQRDD